MFAGEMDGKAPMYSKFSGKSHLIFRVTFSKLCLEKCLLHARVFATSLDVAFSDFLVAQTQKVSFENSENCKLNMKLQVTGFGLEWNWTKGYRLDQTENSRTHMVATCQ